MGDVIRFEKPADEKWWDACADAIVEVLDTVVSDDLGLVNVEDVSIVLARTIFKTFYKMQEKKLPVEDIYQEIDWLQQVFTDSIPAIKQNIWNWTQEEIALERPSIDIIIKDGD